MDVLSILIFITMYLLIHLMEVSYLILRLVKHINLYIPILWNLEITRSLVLVH